jgi:hypothetical protein
MRGAAGCSGEGGQLDAVHDQPTGLDPARQLALSYPSPDGVVTDAEDLGCIRNTDRRHGREA